MEGSVRDVTGLQELPISGPRTGGAVGGAMGEGGQRGLGRSRNCIAVMHAFLSLPAATFAFVGFAFAFAFTLDLAFAFDVKRQLIHEFCP
jgi:hypothetical protein